MDTIIQPLPVSPVGSATSQGRGRNQGQQSPPAGQLLKATVMEITAPGRFVLEIGGSRQPVSTEAQLAVGQNLRLQVVRTEPQIELKIVAGPHNTLQGQSLTLLGKTVKLGELFQGMLRYTPSPLETVSPTSRQVLEDFHLLQQHGLDGRDGGQTLKQLVDRLGLNLEQLLARGDKNQAVLTLKAALLDFAQALTQATDLAETTNRILTIIELFQLAQVQAGENSSLILPLPLPFLDQGYLLIDRDQQQGRNGSASPGDSRFSLHLTVSGLGNVQIDFLQNGEGLFIRFRTADQEKAAFLESFGGDLRQAISAVPLVGLVFSADAPDPIQELLRQLVPAGDSMLDTKV